MGVIYRLLRLIGIHRRCQCGRFLYRCRGCSGWHCFECDDLCLRGSSRLRREEE